VYAIANGEAKPASLTKKLQELEKRKTELQERLNKVWKHLTRKFSTSIEKV
jgi:hypothetical protein